MIPVVVSVLSMEERFMLCFVGEHMPTFILEKPHKIDKSSPEKLTSSLSS